MPKPLPDEIRSQIVQRLKAGQSSRLISDDLGISATTVLRIGSQEGVCSQYKPGSTPRRDPKRNRVKDNALKNLLLQKAP
jgi:hypothetical protein